MDESRGFHQDFILWYEPSPDSHLWVLHQCSLATVVFVPVRSDDYSWCHRQNPSVEIPNTEKIKGTSKTQYLTGKYSIETWRQSFIYISTCILHTSDGQSTSEKLLAPGLNATIKVIHVSPTVSAISYTKQRCGYLFFSFNFRGRRRSKKSAVLQLKCMDEVN